MSPTWWRWEITSTIGLVKSSCLHGEIMVKTREENVEFRTIRDSVCQAPWREWKVLCIPSTTESLTLPFSRLNIISQWIRTNTSGSRMISLPLIVRWLLGWSLGSTGNWIMSISSDRPFYTSIEHDDVGDIQIGEELRKSLEPMMVKYKVDLALGAHIHA